MIKINLQLTPEESSNGLLNVMFPLSSVTFFDTLFKLQFIS